MNFKKIMVAAALLALPIVSVSAKKASALEKNAFCVVSIEIDNEVNGKMIHQITKENTAMKPMMMTLNKELLKKLLVHVEK